MSYPTGNITIPVRNYVNSIVDQFPRLSKIWKVEGSISSRYTRDYLPVNIRGNSEKIEDSYIEFILNSSSEEFFNLDSLFLEAIFDIERSDGAVISDDDQFSVVDGLGHLLLEKSTVHLNSVPIENNAHFGLYNVLKAYTHMSKNHVETYGAGLFYKSASNNIVEHFSSANDKLITENEKKLKIKCKQGLHLMIPVRIDLCSSNQFMLNSVEIRMRFDLASPKKLIKTSKTGIDYIYKLRNVKLHAEKLIPYTSAITSFNKNLNISNSFIPYLFERVICKTYIFSSGHSSYGIENAFNSHIPTRAYICMIKQDAYNGSHDSNTLYLNHCNLSSLTCELNGNNVSVLKTSFPNFAMNSFYHTLNNIQSETNLLTYANFVQGRSIYYFNLEPVDSTDTLPTERQGNLRFSLELNTPLSDNYIIFILGLFHGTVEIDSLRRVKANFLI